MHKPSKTEQGSLMRPQKLLCLYLPFHYLNHLCSTLTRRMCKHFLSATCHTLLLVILKNACFPLTWSCVTDLHLRPHYTWKKQDKCRVLQCQQALFNLFCWCTVMQSRYSTQINYVKVYALVSVIIDQLRGFQHCESSTLFLPSTRAYPLILLCLLFLFSCHATEIAWDDII
jgi:hypothetical protein